MFTTVKSDTKGKIHSSVQWQSTTCHKVLSLTGSSSADNGQAADVDVAVDGWASVGCPVPSKAASVTCLQAALRNTNDMGSLNTEKLKFG